MTEHLSDLTQSVAVCLGFMCNTWHWWICFDSLIDWLIYLFIDRWIVTALQCWGHYIWPIACLPWSVEIFWLSEYMLLIQGHLLLCTRTIGSCLAGILMSRGDLGSGVRTSIRLNFLHNVENKPKNFRIWGPCIGAASPDHPLDYATHYQLLIIVFVLLYLCKLHYEHMRFCWHSW